MFYLSFKINKFYFVTFFLANFFLFLIVKELKAETIKLGIMQDQKGIAAKYAPLIKYFQKNKMDVSLVGFRSYSDAAKKFYNGKINAMFAGSGVAGTLIIKGLAYPLVRPRSKEGWSTYWAVIIVPESNKDFKKEKKYLQSKRIICCSLASSGEFYCKSILGKDAKLLKAGNHGNAINALSKKVADVAVVKNRVWDRLKEKYPDLKQVGKDDGENPNNTLIVSVNIDKEIAKKIKSILLKLKSDDSEEAEAVRKTMNISSFITTEKKDFKHTIALLKKAGVTKKFLFNEK